MYGQSGEESFFVRVVAHDVVAGWTHAWAWYVDGVKRPYAVVAAP